ncbi:MAG: bacterioferritin [Gammaproteobacteria bacterium]|nr:bacterioferritin [Gammaproteobacteria bacterium]
MYVCLCHGITDSEIRDAAASGCSGMSELMMRTGCGSSCGSCIETATEIVAEAIALPVIDEAA